jgi:hypothetical protein
VLEPARQLGVLDKVFGEFPGQDIGDFLIFLVANILLFQWFGPGRRKTVASGSRGRNGRSPARLRRRFRVFERPR